MINSATISQSGIRAANNMMRVSSNNISNINTDNFKKDVVHLKESKNGGVNVSVAKSKDSYQTNEADGGKDVKGSNVDLTEETVNQIVAENQVKANVTALKTSIETEKEILDILV